ncbi:MAG TPA: isoprenylcysteine carboxylmethyltransferase family protein [Gammaproteobacteria bacterium]|nr:isoprenylcysteine carboxylmethyltransferase family protein [Gammaproteobacteria bacterium]
MSNAKSSPEAPADTARVLAPPPVLYGAALVVALVLHYAVHALRFAPRPPAALVALGAVLIVLGLALSIAVVRVFGRAGTPVPPYKPTTRFVSDGPYRYSRNPDYLGQTMTYVGIALVLNTAWPLVLLPLVVVAVQLGVVAREERYLEAKFGQEYRDYKERVRRWI